MPPGIRFSAAGMQRAYGHGLADDLRFFSAGMPSAERHGLAWGLNGLPAATEFVGSVIDVGAWPAGSGPGDLYHTLVPGDQAQVDDLVRRGMDLFHAIQQVVTGPSVATPTAGTAISGGMLLALVAGAYFLLRRR